MAATPSSLQEFHFIVSFSEGWVFLCRSCVVALFTEGRLVTHGSDGSPATVLLSELLVVRPPEPSNRPVCGACWPVEPTASAPEVANG